MTALLAEAQTLYNKLRRLQAADKNGRVQCFTCDVVVHYTKIHAGHRFHSSNYPVRFTEINVHPQCRKCNIDESGNAEAYDEKLVEVYGRDAYDALVVEAHADDRPLSRDEVEAMKTEFRRRIRQEQKKLI